MMNSLGKETLNFGKKAFAFLGIQSSLRRIVNTGIEAQETMNLFEVSMKSVSSQYTDAEGNMISFYDKAINFQKELNSNLHTNIVEMSGYQGTFFNMMKSQMDEQTAYRLSENLTKATVDMSSLYNIDQKKMAQKLQSAMTGQATVLRRNGIGIDISQSSLQTTLDNLGIDKQVTELSYAEKEIARYITILNQAGYAQGDFARTMDQPANQLRMLQNEFKSVIQTIGSYLAGLLAKVLPYINGVIMAIGAMIKSIASLFGVTIDVTASQVGSTLSGVSDSIDDIGSGIDKATGSAKEFQKQILGFDEINNITPPSSGGGSGGGAGGGASYSPIDNKLLDAIKDWDLGLENINKKSEEVRDTILEWVRKITDFLGGAEKVKEIIEGIGISLLAWKISSDVLGFFGRMFGKSEAGIMQVAFGIALAAQGIWFMYNGTKHLMDGNWTIHNIIETIWGLGSGAAGLAMVFKNMGFTFPKALAIGFGIMIWIQGIQVLKEGIDSKDIKKIIAGALEIAIGAVPIAVNIAPKINNVISSLGIFGNEGKHAADSANSLSTNFIKLGAGAIGLSVSLLAASDSIKGLADGSKDADLATAQLGISMAGAIASGALMGSTFGPLGTIIGGCGGAIVGATTALIALEDSTSNISRLAAEANDVHKESLQNYEKYKQKMNEITGAYEGQKEVMIENVKQIQLAKGILEEYVDENGFVKSNIEDVENALKILNNTFGTGYQIIDGRITDNGKLIDSYKDLGKAINDYTDDYIINSLKQIAIDRKSTAIQRIQTINDELEKAREEFNKINQAGKEAVEEFENKGFFGQAVDTIILGKAKDIETMSKESEQAYTRMIELEKELTKAKSDTGDSIDEIMLKMIKENELSSYLSEGTAEDIQAIVNAYENGATDISLSLDNLGEQAEIFREQERERQHKMVNDVKELTPEIVEEWKALATKSSSEFEKELSEIDESVQGRILVNTTTVQNASSLVNSWKSLASKSESEFRTAISQVDSDTKIAIMTSIAQTQGYSKEYAETWYDLAKAGDEQYQAVLEKLPEDTQEQINKAVTAVSMKYGDMETATKYLITPLQAIDTYVDLYGKGSSLAWNFSTGISSQQNSVANSSNVLASTFDAGIRAVNAFALGENISSGLSLGITSRNSLWSISNAVNTIASSIPSSIKKILNIHSPSKVTEALGEFTSEGLAMGIKKGSDTVYGVIEELSQGIILKTSDLDFTSTANIDTNVNKNISNNAMLSFTEQLSSGIKDMIVRAIQTATVNVNIEAKTEEGVIVKKATEGINEYINRTGELPFPVLI